MPPLTPTIIRSGPEVRYDALTDLYAEISAACWGDAEPDGQLQSPPSLVLPRYLCSVKLPTPSTAQTSPPNAHPRPLASSPTWLGPHQAPSACRSRRPRASPPQPRYRALQDQVSVEPRIVPKTFTPIQIGTLQPGRGFGTRIRSCGTPYRDATSVSLNRAFQEFNPRTATRGELKKIFRPALPRGGLWSGWSSELGRLPCACSPPSESSGSIKTAAGAGSASEVASGRSPFRSSEGSWRLMRRQARMLGAGTEASHSAKDGPTR